MDGLGHMKKKDVVDIYPFYKVISSKSGKLGAVWEVDKGMIKCYSVPTYRGNEKTCISYVHTPAIFTVLDRGEKGWYAIHVIGETTVDWINVYTDKHMLQSVTLKKIA